MDYPINDDGIALLEEFEDFVGVAYPDPISPLGKALQAQGLWRTVLVRGYSAIPQSMREMDGAPVTIGFGFTAGVKPGDTMSRTEANRQLAELLRPYVQAVERACPDANENELAAMVCLAWNIGIAGFQKSTVRKAHARGDKQAAARAFGLWNKSRGKVVAGLTRRRAAESALYLKPVPGAAVNRFLPPVDAMPQRVDPETSLARSPIIAGSTLTAGTATVGVVAEAARGAREIRDSLGDWLPWVIVAVAVAGAGWAVWSRVRQRKNGWA